MYVELIELLSRQFAAKYRKAGRRFHTNDDVIRRPSAGLP